MVPDREAGKRDRAAPAGPIKSTTTGQKPDEDFFAKPRAPSLMSPSKGILLTPGTGTTRRKNVSFGSLALNDKANVEQSRQIKSVLELDEHKPSVAKPLSIDQRSQTNLTKALYKAKIDASKGDLDQKTGDDVSEDRFLPFEAIDGYRAKSDSQDEVADSSADTTIDLNQPFSRSGKHWKAEYERYHKKSTREMKELIKYGQGVKSFAVKKDSEASELGEKLHLELSKVAAMEVKVSRLAAQLASARLQGSEDADQARLVKDLAKQTALAVRYKQKADRYRSSLLKNISTIAQAENGVEIAPAQGPKPLSMDSSQTSNNTQEMILLRGELDRFRESAKVAEERAKLLEVENATLRESMSRLKAEAASYENKRLAREADLKKKAAVMTSAKEDCEALPNQITTDNKKLLRPFHIQGDSQRKAGNQTKAFSESEEKPNPLDLAVAAKTAKTTVPKVVSQPSKPAHGIKPQESHVDIWTLSAQGDETNESPSTKKRTSHQVSDHMESDIFSALREIDQNTISERESGDMLPSFNRAAIPRTPAKLHKRHHKSELLPENTPKMRNLPETDSEKAPLIDPQPAKYSASKRMRERRSTITSPRPSLLTFVPSPPKTISSNPILRDPSSQLTSLETSLPYTSSVPIFPASSVAAAASRTHPLAGARRQRTLPAERAAAARARLKERSIGKSMIGGRREGRARRRAKEDGKGGIVKVEGPAGGGSDDQREE